MIGGEDFVGTATSVEFVPGTTTANFTLQIIEDGKFEGTEYFAIQLVEMHTCETFKVKVGDPSTAFGEIIDQS